MRRSDIGVNNDSIEYIDSDPGSEEEIEFELGIYDALLKNVKAQKYILRHKGKAIKQNQDQEYYCCIQLQNINARRLKQIHNHYLRRNQINKIFLSLCKCVQFFHSQNIVHCDINIQNVFVDDEQNCKIINFRYALNLNQKPDSVSLKRQYPIAPEINCQEDDSSNNSDSSSQYSYFPKQHQPFKIDSYSLGVLFFFLNTKTLDIKKRSNIKIPKQQSDIIQGCLHRNFQKRWSIQKIISEAKKIYQSTRSTGTRSNTSSIDNENITSLKSKNLVKDELNLLVTKSQLPFSAIQQEGSFKTWDYSVELPFSFEMNLRNPKSIQNNFKKLTIIFQFFLMNYKILIKFQFSALLQMVLSKFNFLLSEFQTITSFSQQYQQRRKQFVSKYKLLKQKINQQNKKGLFSQFFNSFCNFNQNKQRKLDRTESRAPSSISNQRQSIEQRLKSQIFCEFAKLPEKFKDYQYYNGNTLLVFLTTVQYFQQLINFKKQFEDIDKHFEKFLNNFIAIKLGQIDKSKRVESNSILKSKLKDIYSNYSHWKSH